MTFLLTACRVVTFQGWMLRQEASTEPYYEEEVEEAMLPSLHWRAEGRARRPVLVRGGILADEVRSRMYVCALQ